LVKKIAGLYHRKISVESEENKGSTFIISLS
jgi:signal transduction histidine kinase